MLSQICLAQIKVTPLYKKDIPPTIHFDGRIVNAARFSYKDGEHIIIVTETGIVNLKGDDSFRKADLYAYQYKISNGAFTLNWQLHDFSGDCGVDPKAEYIPNTFAVTDLDNNGVAEVWLMYSTACRGDVSPANMKIIMHEGIKKYAVRGTNKVKVSDKEFYGGKYIFDDAFNAGPKAFKDYALKLWNKNLMEKW